MTFAQITDSLEIIRKYGMEIVQFLVTTLVALLIIGSIIMGVFEPDPAPIVQPPVLVPNEYGADDDGCMIIDSLRVCPIATDMPLESRLMDADVLPKDGNRNPYGETRHPASIEAKRGIKLVSHVLQVKKPIKVYAATFKDGPAAYARDLGATSEIVYSQDTYEQLLKNGHASNALIGLWGHEVGHVKYRENPVVHDRFENEGSAEYFAGATIFRLGGTEFNAVQEYTTIFSGNDDKHPPHHVGKLIAHEGWRQAKVRHENPYNKCRSGLIGETFYYKKRDRVCRAAITCRDENRPVVIACKKDNGSWSWL